MDTHAYHLKQINQKTDVIRRQCTKQWVDIDNVVTGTALGILVLVPFIFLSV